MFDLADITLKCPCCPGIMDFVHDGCYVCSECNVEVWGDPARRGRVTTWEANEVYRMEQQRRQLLRKPGGSSKSSGRKLPEKQHKVHVEICGVKPYWRGYDE